MAARYFRLRIRTAADSADALILSSYPGDPYPYLVAEPSGDGQQLDPATGQVDLGAYTIQAADGNNVITAALVDADGRQTLAHRRAYIEQSTDGAAWSTVLLAGYVNGYRLVDAITWEFTIGESQRVEQMRRVFDRTSDTFEQVTCLFGGPVKGGWGPLRDYGGWVFKVTAVDADLVTLQFVEGFLPVTDILAVWGWVRNALSDWSRERVNRVIFNNPKTILSGITVFEDLTAEVQDLDGTLVDRFTPALQVDVNVRLFDFSGAITKLDKLQLLRTSTPWEATPPSVDAEFRVYLWREVISEENPLHIDMHPVDIVTGLWDDAGVPYDTTAAAAVRAALGDRTRLTLRITEGYQLQAFLQDVIFGTFGIATRRGTDGEMELYIARVRSLTVPSSTYDLNDLRSPDTVIFELDEETIYNTVVVEQEVYAPWSLASGQGRAVDDVVPIKITNVIELDSDGDGIPDSATEGPRELRFTIPGCVRLAESGFDEIPFFVAQGIAAEVFDRFGKGGVFGNADALPDLTEQVGQELILNVAHLPNAGVRGGARVLQIVQRTETPAGPAVRLLDSGPTSQFATSPTFSLAANAGKPKKVVDVTVTNQAALLTAEAWLRVEWSVEASQPTGNGSLLVTYQPADVPASFSTPAVDAGSRVWVRMQAFRPGMRPTAWTAWQDVNLADLTAPSALAQAQDPDDAGITEVSWTLGESDVPVEVYQRPQGDPAGEARLVDLLPGGSDRLRMDLTPGLSYTIGVRHREASPFGGVSTTTEISFTVAGTTPTLAAPTISAFSIVKGLDIELFNFLPQDTEAVVGVCLRAAITPSFYEIEMATETAIGSGTPGSYSLVQTMAAAVDQDAKYSITQPIDGKFRYFRARHIREGALPSGYSEVVSALPGWPQACDLPVPSFDIEPGDMQVGRYDFIGALASDPVVTTRVSGDTITRLSVRADGRLEWGPGGAAALDTNLYRSGANELRTDDALIVAGLLSPLAGIALTGTLLIGGDANLYRNAANELKTDDALVVAGLLTAQAGLTVSGGPATVAASVAAGAKQFSLLGSSDAVEMAHFERTTGVLGNHHYDSYTLNIRGRSGGGVAGTPIFRVGPDPSLNAGALIEGGTTVTFNTGLNARFNGFLELGTSGIRTQGNGFLNVKLGVSSSANKSIILGTYSASPTTLVTVTNVSDVTVASVSSTGLGTFAGGLSVTGGSILATGIAATVGALTATTGTFTGLLQTTLTTQQLSLRYDAANHLAVTVGATGLVTLNATGTGAAFSFSDSVLLGTTTPATGSPRLDVVGTVGLVLSNVASGVVEKGARIGVRHYTDAQNPMALVVGFAGDTYNRLVLGGGTSTFHAATTIQFYTAATTTTPTGTLAADLTGVGTASLFYGRGSVRFDKGLGVNAAAPTDGKTRLGTLGLFDSAVSTPDLDDVLRYNGTEWIPVALQFRFTDGDVVAQAYTDGTASAYVHDGRTLSGTPSAPGSAPTISAGYKSIVVDMSGIAGGLPATEAWVVQWSDDAGVSWSDTAGDEIVTTGSVVMHTKLLLGGTTYRYRVRRRGATTSAASPSTSDLAPLSIPDITPATIILASQIATVDLASISANIGVITAGAIRNAANTKGILISGAMSSWGGWTRFLNLVDETDNFIEHERFKVHHDGTVIVSDGTNTLFTINSAGNLANWQNTAGTAGIAVVGAVPGGWTNYVNLTGTGQFLQSPLFRAAFDGSVLMATPDLLGAWMFFLTPTDFRLQNYGATAGVNISGTAPSTWNVGLDLVGRLLTIQDEQGTPVTRVQVGKFGTTDNYGIKVFGADGTLRVNITSTNVFISLKEMELLPSTAEGIDGVGTYTAAGDSSLVHHRLTYDLASTIARGWLDAPIVATGRTIATRRAIDIQDVTGAGSVTTNIGLYIASLTKGGTDWAIYTEGGGIVRFGDVVRLYSTVSSGNLQSLQFWGKTTGTVVERDFTYWQGVILDGTFGSEDGSMELWARVAGSTTKVFVAGPGLVVGAPTGGDQGVGTINAVAVYDDGVGPLTDYVFERYHGLTPKDRPDYEWLPLAGLRAFTAKEYRLPMMPSRETFEQERSLGRLVHGLWEATELHTTYLFDHEDRIRALEVALADSGKEQR